MSAEKFRIYKDQSRRCWTLTYPAGFWDPERHNGVILLSSISSTFATFIRECEKQCPMCGRGEVRDTDWGWECTACGNYDVAVGCTRDA